MSIYSRPYMREPNFRSSGGWSALKWIMGVLVVVFILQMVFRLWFGLEVMEEWLGLSVDNLLRGLVYTPLSYGLLHEAGTGFPWHLGLNCLFLWWFGRAVEARIGSARFLDAFIVAVFLGGIVWLLTRVVDPTNAYVVGASAGVNGIFMLFCLQNWNEQMRLLFPPVNITGKWFFYVFGGLQLFFFLFEELPPGVSGNVAHSAHLGGMLGGFLYDRYLTSRGTLTDWWQGWGAKKKPVTKREPAWVAKKPALKENKAGRFRVNVSSKQDLRREVDRILDKINAHGFGSLTTEEKATLDRAKDDLN